MTEIDDIDRFIHEQKAKLSQDRNRFNDHDNKLSDDAIVPDYEEIQNQHLANSQTRANGFPETRRKWSYRTPRETFSMAEQRDEIPRARSPDEIPIGERLGKHEEIRKRYLAERHSDYLQMMAKKTARDSRGRQQRSAGSDYEKSLPLSNRHSAQLKKIQERNKEYNDLISKGFSEGKFRRPGGSQFSDYSDFIDAASEEGWEVYELFPEEDDDIVLGPQDEYYATLPVRDVGAELQAKAKQTRNDEYNEFIKKQGKRRRRFSLEKPPDPDIVEPKPGWETPTYDEILDQKRKEESKYRRYDDPEYNRPGTNNAEINNRMREQTVSVQPPRSQFADDTTESRLLSASRRHLRETAVDPNAEYEELMDKLRRNRREFERDLYNDDGREYYQHAHRQRNTSARELTHNSGYSSYAALPPQLNDRRPSDLRERRPSLQSPRRNVPVPGATRPVLPVEPTDHTAANKTPRAGLVSTMVDNTKQTSYQPTFATLNIGADSAERKKQKQDLYRAELEKQIAERRALKQQEKQYDLRVVATGARDPEKAVDRLRDLRPHDLVYKDTSPRLEAKPPIPPNALNLVPATIQPPAPHAPRLADIYPSPIAQATELLERSSLRNRQFDPALMSALDTGVTATQLQLNTEHEAYKYYGASSPLEGEGSHSDGLKLMAGYNGYTESGLPVPSWLTDRRVPILQAPHLLQQHSPNSWVDGQGNHAAAPNVSPRLPDATDDKSRKLAYQQELQRQIQERQRQKLREKEDRDRYEKKLEAEIQNYDPFGQGGGGAPLRDSEGNVIADRRLMLRKAETQQTRAGQGLSPRPAGVSPGTADVLTQLAALSNQESALDALAASFSGTAPQVVQMQPQTLTATDRYKADLQKQIDEKKAKHEAEKERNKLEEEREEARLQQQLKKIKVEYEAEQQKKKEKEEEAQRKNEELAKQAEEKKREAERLRKLQQEEEEKARRQEQEEERQRRLQEQQAQRQPSQVSSEGRSNSPPVPALRKQLTGENGSDEERAFSIPPAKTPVEQDTQSVRSIPGARAPSAEVINQLARMRAQLETERRRVEGTLQDRDMNPSQTRDVSHHPEDDLRDIFATGPATADRNQYEDFAKLKNQDPDDKSRQELKQYFRSEPRGGDQLEAEQRILLHNQRENLRELRDNVERTRPPRHRPDSTTSRLDSDSDFITVGGRKMSAKSTNSMLGETQIIRHGVTLPAQRGNTDFDKLRRRRQDKKDADDISLSSFLGTKVRDEDVESTFSFDIDRIAQRNKERLRKLNSDGISLTESLNEPDDILSRFMQKNRIGSGAPRTRRNQHTPNDESWLQSSPAAR